MAIEKIGVIGAGQMGTGIAHVLALSTEPDDVLLIYGQDWDSTTAYFANRRAVMVTDARFTDPASVEEVLHRLKDDDITALVVTGHRLPTVRDRLPCPRHVAVGVEQRVLLVEVKRSV